MPRGIRKNTVALWLCPVSERLQKFDQVVLLLFRETETEMLVVVIDHGSVISESTIVIEAALRVREETAKGRRSIVIVGRPA